MNFAQKKAYAVFIVTIVSTSMLSFVAFWMVSNTVLSQQLYTVENNDFNGDDVLNKRPYYETEILNDPIPAYPQYYREYSPYEQELLVGQALDNNLYQNVKISDDKYGGVIPIESSRSYTLDTFYKFSFGLLDLIESLPLGLGDVLLPSSLSLEERYQLSTLWMLFRIEPDDSAYLGFDSFLSNSCAYTQIGETDYIHSRFSSANNPYLSEFNDRYFEFVEDDGVTEDLIFSVDCGGVALYNDTLHNFYDAINDALDRLESKYQFNMNWYDLLIWVITQLLNPTRSDIIREYYLTTVGMWLDENPEFVDWWIGNVKTFQEFVGYLNIDLTTGFRSYTNFDPYAITRIDSKINYYIDMPYEEPNLPEILSVDVQAWNYFTENWVTVFTREEQVPLQLINTQITDEFYIDINPWQYIDPWLNGSANFVQYRVIVSSNRGVGDTGDITFRFGGIWTKLTQEFIEIVYDMYFKVDDHDITSSDLKTNPIFSLEYHTEGFQNPNDGIFISRSIVFILDVLYNIVDLTENPEDFVNYIISFGSGSPEPYPYLINAYSVAIDESIKFGASPIIDSKKGIIVPMDMVRNDTSVLMRIHGIFGKYNRDGEIQTPKLYIDKAAVLYEYEVPIEIESKSYIDPNTLDYFYVSYDVPISPNFVSIEVPIPDDYVLIDHDTNWGLIESPRQKDITHYWIDSVEIDPVTHTYVNEPLFSTDFFRITAKIVFFERTGIYRFWFRVQNYAKSIVATRYNGENYNLYDIVDMERVSNYTMSLRDFDGKYIKTNIEDWEGTFFMEVRGQSFDGMSSEFMGPIYGFQNNYTVYNNDTELFETRYNEFRIMHNHTFTDGVNGTGLWGDLSFTFIWKSADNKHIGFTIFKLTVMRVSTEPPIISIVDPQQNTRWGANTINYMIVKAYHINTISVQAQFFNDNIIYNLTNLEDAMYDPEFEGIIPPDLIDVPSSRRFLYWFAAFSGSDLAYKYPPVDGVSQLSVDIWGTSQAGVTNYTSDPISVSFVLVDRSNFELLTVYDIYLNQRVLLKYYCPNGITTMRIYIFDGVNQILISVIGNGTESVYLYEGYQSYVIPFRFTFEGQFSIIVEVFDDVDNFMVYESNQFYVQNDDTRPWYMRILDETFEILGIWSSFTLSTLGIGVVAIKRKYKNNTDTFKAFVMDDPFDQEVLEGLRYGK